MASKGIKSSSNMQARIKKMMQSDEDVGKVAKAAPVLIAKALDVFLLQLVQGAADIAQQRGAKMLTASHIKAHVESTEVFDFLKDAVANVPELPPEGAETKKAKRPRKSTDDGEAGAAKTRSRGGRGSGRGARGGRGKKVATTDEDTEADEGQAAAEPAAMDVDPAADPGDEAADEQDAAAPTAASAQQQEQQPEQPAAEEEQQHAVGVQPAAAPQNGSDVVAVDAALAVAASVEVPVAVPAFLMAQAAAVGGDAEEEDYDA